jgi:hypothetical protein
MRLIFGVLSLLVVLAIIGSIGKKQLQALNSGTVSTRASTAASQAGIELPPPGSRDGATIGIPGGMPGATAADTSTLTVPQQAANMQQQIRNDAARALQQGADRNARATP